MQFINLIFVLFSFSQHIRLGHSIVGGNEAQTTPYHALLLIRPAIGSPEQHTFVGSGSIITRQHVLTCAQNVFGFNYFRVGVGSNSRQNLTFYQSTNSTWHPFYDRTTLRNNIAVIVLDEIIEFNENVHAIALPRFGAGIPFPFEEGTITGFGMIDMVASIYSPRLLRSFHRVLPGTECTLHYPNMDGQMAQNFCARDYHAFSNICGGDQGSAFAVLERGVWTAFGVASFTCELCCVGSGAVYVRVSSYRQWIRIATNGTID